MATRREETIARLEEQKRSLVEDLRNAGADMAGSQWMADRVAELARVNRWLAQMGAAPAHVVVA